MPLSVTHTFVSAIPDDPAAGAAGDVLPQAHWNALHTVTGTPAVPFNAQTGTTYTLQASDNGGVVTLNNAAAVTVTCPSGLGAGFSCMIVQLGAGQVGVVAGGGATLNSLSALSHLSGQYAMGTILAPTANGFILGGQLS